MVVVVAVWLVKEEVQVVFHRGKMEAGVFHCWGFVNFSRCVFGRCMFLFLVIAREVELEVKRSISTKIRSS